MPSACSRCRYDGRPAAKWCSTRAESRPGVHVIGPDDALTFRIGGCHLNRSTHAKTVGLAPAQADFDPGVLGGAFVHEQLVVPGVARPHAAEAGIDVLQPVVVEIEEYNPVPLLYVTRAEQH